MICSSVANSQFADFPHLATWMDGVRPDHPMIRIAE
jgi:hypothetical protein